MNALFFLIVHILHAYILLFCALHSRGCLTTLKNMSPSATSNDYAPLLECLVSWGHGSSVLELISDWLVATLKTNPKGKKVSFHGSHFFILKWLHLLQNVMSIADVNCCCSRLDIPWLDSLHKKGENSQILQI